MKKTPLLHYQFVLLNQAFYSGEIAVNELAWYMHALLPLKYSDDFMSFEPLTKEQLKQEVILAGSSAFEALIDAADKSGHKDLAHALKDHNVNELYRYVWIWSEDRTIMKRGQSWFTDKETCKIQGRKNAPSYATFDGPGCPVAQLSVEAICPCFIHCVDQLMDVITQPCMCFTPTVPEYLKDKSELTIDGHTIIKTPVADFSPCPKYEYIIKENGEIFTSHEKDIYIAYLERCRRTIVSK